MSILNFGYEDRFRDKSQRRRPWIPGFLRPVSAMGRLHFLGTLKQFQKYLLESESGRVLEVGGKQGHISFWLARNYPYQVIGLDIDQEFITENQTLRNKLNIANLTFAGSGKKVSDGVQNYSFEFRNHHLQLNHYPFAQGDLTEPINELAPFDLIFCSHVLEHIEADVAVLKNLFGITRPGGYL